jgi:hypothetical protein
MAAQNQIIVGEIIFKGGNQKGVVQTGSVSAEDFISRLDDLQRTNAWTDAAASAMARSWLRDEANDWFNEFLAFGPYKALRDRMIASYVVFKEEFKKTYFVINSTTDVSADWSSLKQKSGESATAFGRRLMGTINRYATLLPLPTATQADQDNLAAALTALIANDNAAARRNYDQALTNMNRNVADATQTVTLADMGVKFLAQGLSHPKLVEVVRKQERRRAALPAVLTALDDAESNLSNKLAPVGVTHKSTIPVLTQMAEISAETDGYVSEGEMAAIRQYRNNKASGAKPKQPMQHKPKPSQGGTEKTRTTNYGGATKPRPRLPPSGTPYLGPPLKGKEGNLYYCTHCEGRVGHVMRNCPKYLKNQPATDMNGMVQTEDLIQLEPSYSQESGKANGSW